MSKTILVEIPDEVGAALQELGDETGRPPAAVARELLTEAARTRRFPGITFADSPIGRVARLAGTEQAVFGVIAAYNRAGGNWERFRQACSGLDEAQLRLALAYRDAYADEVATQMDADDQRAIKAIWTKHPATRPA